LYLHEEVVAAGGPLDRHEIFFLIPAASQRRWAAVHVHPRHLEVFGT
jgi:putative AlgH/UPF0301 family transcriptional regulator